MFERSRWGGWKVWAPVPDGPVNGDIGSEPQREIEVEPVPETQPQPVKVPEKTP